jgi:hypothetical protein
MSDKPEIQANINQSDAKLPKVSPPPPPLPDPEPLPPWALRRPLLALLQRHLLIVGRRIYRTQEERIALLLLRKWLILTGVFVNALIKRCLHHAGSNTPRSRFLPQSRGRHQIPMEDALDQELVRSADCHSLAVLRELRGIRDPSGVPLKSANARAAITDFLRT